MLLSNCEIGDLLFRLLVGLRTQFGSMTSGPVKGLFPLIFLFKGVIDKPKMNLDGSVVRPSAAALMDISAHAALLHFPALLRFLMGYGLRLP